MKPIRRLGFAIAFLLVAPVALAQAAPLQVLPPELLEAFGPYALLISLVFGVVAAIRQRWSALDGPVVILFSVGTGAAIALGLSRIGSVTGPVLDALLVGALAGLLASIFADGIGAIAQKFAPVTLLEAPHSALGETFILDLARNLVPRASLPAAVVAISGLLAEYGGAVLTDELRVDLQGRVHAALRRAGLLQGRDLGA